MINIDHSAKLSIDLTSRPDDKNNIYYTGKLQIAAKLDLEYGNNIMVFTSEDGLEEMQISPIDHSKKKSRKEIITARYEDDVKIIVPLQKRQDTNGKTFFVGELFGIGNLDLIKGLFFTIFTSREGHEQLQITGLKHKNKEGKENV